MWDLCEICVGMCEICVGYVWGMFGNCDGIPNDLTTLDGKDVTSLTQRSKYLCGVCVGSVWGMCGNCDGIPNDLTTLDTEDVTKDPEK